MFEKPKILVPYSGYGQWLSKIPKADITMKFAKTLTITDDGDGLLTHSEPKKESGLFLLDDKYKFELIHNEEVEVTELLPCSIQANGIIPKITGDMPDNIFFLLMSEDKNGNLTPKPLTIEQKQVQKINTWLNQELYIKELEKKNRNLQEQVKIPSYLDPNDGENYCSELALYIEAIKYINNGNTNKAQSLSLQVEKFLNATVEPKEKYKEQNIMSHLKKRIVSAINTNEKQKKYQQKTKYSL